MRAWALACGTGPSGETRGVGDARREHGPERAGGGRAGQAGGGERCAAWAAGEGEGDGPWGREGVAGPAWGGGLGCCALRFGPEGKECGLGQEREKSRPGWVALVLGFLFPSSFLFFSNSNHSN